jgi:FtsH-binding integral membrane protein
MRILGRLKYILFATLLGMYLTGFFTWVMSHWLQVDGPLGLEPSPARLWWLQSHSVISLWFLILFGYLFHSHVEPSWRRGQKLKSGAALTGTFILLIVTVPGLFYLTNETLKSSVVWIHTYVGLSVLAVFLIHYFGKKKRMRHR